MRIKSFTVTNAIRAISTASIEVVGLLTDYPTFAIGSQVVLTCTRSTGGSSGTYTVFTGRVKSFNPTDRVSSGEKVYTVNCVSIQSLLMTTPLVSERFADTTPANVIKWIFQLGGLVKTTAPADYALWVSAPASATVGGNTVLFNDVLDENSSMDALEKIAICCNWIWHIKGDGKMYFESLGGAGAASDFVASRVFDMQESVQEYDQVSAYKIRGQYKTPLAQVVDLVDYTQPQPFVRDSEDKNVAYFSFTTSASYTYESVKSAVVITGDDPASPSTGEVYRYDPATRVCVVRVTVAARNGIDASGNAYLRVIANVIPKSATEGIDVRGLGTGSGTMAYSRDGMSQLFNMGGGSYAIFDRQASKLTYEASQERYEATVTDATLVSQMGHRIREMDIPYAQTDILSGIGTFLLAMTKRQSRRVTMSGPFVSQFNVNTKWRLPKLVNGVQESVLGVLQWLGTADDPYILDKATITFNAENAECTASYDFLAPVGS